MKFVIHEFNSNCVQIVVIIAFRWSLQKEKRTPFARADASEL